MTLFELLPTGLSIASVPDIRESMNADIRAANGTSLDLSDNDPLGALVGIVADRIGEVAEVVQQVNASQDPDGATGTGLEALCALTGTLKRPATYSADTLTLTGTPTTLVAAGSQASTTSTSKAFETLEDATIAALTAWVNTTSYVVDDRRTNSSRCYVCITAGTSAGSGGPTTTSDDITDGTVHWRYLGEGTGAIDVDAQSVITGPIVALSGDITTITTPVSGWSSVRNLLDADEGSNIETDEQLRVRRVAELSAAGVSTPDAIRSAILDVPDVIACTVFYNNSDLTDGDGVPPHSVEVVVQGGEDQDILDTLLANVAAGIGTYSSGAGAVAGTADDDEGTAHAFEFTRPEEIEIWVLITLSKDPDTYAGDAAVETAIIAWGDARPSGLDIRASAVSAQSFVDGVYDVSQVLIGTVNPPVASTTITVTSRQIATFDTGRIGVTSSDGTP